MPKKTIAQLTAELKKANEELAILREANGDITTALNAYKERVKQRALEAKEEYDWCEAIDEILRDLDIDPAMPRFRFTVMMPVTFEATLRRFVNLNLSNDWVTKTVNLPVIERLLGNSGQSSLEDESAILSNEWDTYQDGYDSRNDWSIEVGKITLQSIEPIEG